MDWLEEKIEQFKKYLQDKALVGTLVWYLCIGMAGVAAACWITQNLCMVWMEVLQKRQAEMMAGEYYDYAHMMELLAKRGRWEEMLFLLLKYFCQYCLYLYILIAFIFAGKSFLETKIRQPNAAYCDPGIYGISAEICAGRPDIRGDAAGKTEYHTRTAGTSPAFFQYYDYHPEYGKMGAFGSLVQHPGSGWKDGSGG